MPSICFYFEVHQPMRLNRFSVFNIGDKNSSSSYFDRKLNKEIFIKIKETLNRNQDLIHLLKIAFDVEADSTLIEQHVEVIHKSCNEILEIISRE